MEFDELKKIWYMGNKESAYTINETALHERIMAKKSKTNRITNFSEWLAIAVNGVAGLFILALNISRKPVNVFMCVMAAWMLLSVLFVIFNRTSRMRKESRFDESMLGNLRQALSTARHQVRLSRFLRFNGLVVAMLTALELWEAGKAPVFTLGIMILFILANWAAGWEHHYYEKRSRELEVMLGQLEQE